VALRPFAEPLAVGDIFSAEIDPPAEYDDYSMIGFPFAIIGFRDAAGEETFNIEAGSSVVYGDFNWRYDAMGVENGDFGVDAGGTSIAPTDVSDGSTFSLEILSETTGRFTLMASRWTSHSSWGCRSRYSSRCTITTPKRTTWAIPPASMRFISII
jgi:hypothetical protein